MKAPTRVPTALREVTKTSQGISHGIDHKVILENAHPFALYQHIYIYRTIWMVPA